MTIFSVGIIDEVGCRDLYDSAPEAIKKEFIEYARDFTSRPGIDPKLVKKIIKLKLQILTSGESNVGTFLLDKEFKDLLAANRADLKDIDLRRVEIHGADLEFAKLDGADFRRATLYDVSLKNAELHNADFRRATLNRVTFEDAELHNVKFRRAKLEKVVLKEAELYGADFRRATLNVVTFEHTKLSDVDLREAELDDVNLEFAGFIWMKLYLEDIDGLIAEIGENRDNVSIERLVIFSQDENIVLAELVYDSHREQLSLKEAESNGKLHKFLTNKASELNLQTVTLEEARKPKPAQKEISEPKSSDSEDEVINTIKGLSEEELQQFLVELARHLVQLGDVAVITDFLTKFVQEQSKQNATSTEVVTIVDKTEIAYNGFG